MKDGNSRKGILRGLAALVLALPAIALCDYWGRPELARAGFFTAGSVVVVIEVRWELRRRLWFWITMSGLAAAQIPLIMAVGEPIRRWPIPLLFFPMMADIILMFTVLRILERLPGIREGQQRASPSAGGEK